MRKLLSTVDVVVVAAVALEAFAAVDSARAAEPEIGGAGALHAKGSTP